MYISLINKCGFQHLLVVASTSIPIVLVLFMYEVSRVLSGEIYGLKFTVSTGARKMGEGIVATKWTPVNGLV